jgi:hypothetical protein
MRMKKYEACGALCELREEVARDMKYAQEKLAEEGTAEGTAEWYAKEVKKFQRWLEALEVAGTALTR